MADSPKKYTFISRNLVTIVMIPVLIGIHLGWSQLQKNDILVREDERKGQPIFNIVERLWDTYVLRNNSSENTTATDKK